MSSKRSNSSRSGKPSEVDDLTLITGIGPAVESRLHGVGIYTFAQLAALSPADIAASVSGLTGLTAERIIKQNWIGQAHNLSPQSTLSEPDWIKDVRQLSANRTVTRQKDEAEIPVDDQPDVIATDEPQENLVVASQKLVGTPTNPQYIATFTVDLVLNEDNEVLHTELVHIQSRNKETWVGWQASHLVGFMLQQAGVKLPSNESISVVTKEEAVLTDIEETDFTLSAAEKELTIAGIEAAELTPPVVEAEDEIASAIPEAVASACATGARKDLLSVLHLSKIETIAVGAESPGSLLPSGQPYDVRLTLDFTDVAVPDYAPLNYTASICAKKLGDHTRQLVGEAHGSITPSEKASIRVEGTTLAQGIYRLEAAVSLTLTNEEASSRSDLTAQMKGRVLQVY